MRIDQYSSFSRAFLVLGNADVQSKACPYVDLRGRPVKRNRTSGVFQIGICPPSSTRRLVGMQKDSAAFAAFFASTMNSFSRQPERSGRTLGTNVSRPRKKDVSMMSNRTPKRP